MEQYGGFFWKENFVFSEKKIAECIKLAVKCDWKGKTSRNLQNLVIVKKIYGFFEKKLWFCKNRQKLKTLLLDATEIVRLLKALKIVFFLKKRLIFQKKILGFLKTAKSNQFDAECKWNSKISQNVQKLGFFEKVDWFSKKLLFF